MTIHGFFQKAEMQDHPMRILYDFLEQERVNEAAGRYEDLRFVGYVLDIGYDTVTIITSDPFKIAVGGVPRNSLLIMVPSNLEDLPPHFTLLRVLESAPTPLSAEVQQTYFELQKKSMPEIDVFTQSELQWGALKTGVLGMFYCHPEMGNAVEFSGDLNNFVSAHKYMVYSPDDNLLRLIINSMVPQEDQFSIGYLRLTECRMPLPNDQPHPDVRVFVSTRDFMGTRTAMFGKTRLGKSNVVKLIAQSLIETTEETRNVGQLIFDINGEYANDNPQDGSRSLRSGYPDRCRVYAVSPKPATPSEPLKLNFYEQPNTSHQVIGSLLMEDRRTSGYIKSFISVEIPSLEEIVELPFGGERTRAVRKIQIYWAILSKAGYPADETRLREIAPSGSGGTKGFDPGFSEDLRRAAYGGDSIPQRPQTLRGLVRELEVINRFRRSASNNELLMSSSRSGKPIFDADDLALLEFFDPSSGSGTSWIQPYRMYHYERAGDFITGILDLLNEGYTVILDLGNANPQVMEYFSKELSAAVFQHQVGKFTGNALGNHYIQLYFEEAHNLFPHDEDKRDIYSRLAKEGAKYHIGMVYSTQSPTTINRDLLAQTENFFVAHLSSRDDVNAIAKVEIAYDTMTEDILRAKTPGYIRMLTRAHRFVVPVQAWKFELTAPGIQPNN
jgi:hypothetical protein